MTRPISFVSTKSLIRHTINDHQSKRPQTVMAFEYFSWKADCIANSNRAHAVFLARLRSGSIHLFSRRTPTYWIRQPYPLCKAESQIVELWLKKRLNLDFLRQLTFGGPLPPLRVLTFDPEKVLALARATFKSPRRRPEQRQRLLLAAQ